MTTEIKGPFSEQLQILNKKFEEDKKAIEERSQFCEIIKTEVIKELEKEYDFKSYKEFKRKFDKFINLVEDHLETKSPESKNLLTEIISDFKKWGNK